MVVLEIVAISSIFLLLISIYLRKIGYKSLSAYINQGLLGAILMYSALVILIGMAP